VEFHSLRAGRFQIDTKEGIKTFYLSHSIGMMSTPVTQKQWVEVMGENPSRFQKGEHSIEVKVNGKSIRMQPDNPVEQVTWWSVLVFANKLSKKYGFTPTYNLSDMTWVSGTRAEDGTLRAKRGEVKINAKGKVYDSAEGDIYYKAEGFRLPTDVEQEYVLRAAGTADGKYYFGGSEAKLKDHAWYGESSDGRTHPVAQLKPLVIEGKQFYDLHGNVWEWGWKRVDFRGESSLVELKGDFFCVLCGGSWYSKKHSLLSGDFFYDEPSLRHSRYGFRLVRTGN